MSNSYKVLSSLCSVLYVLHCLHTYMIACLFQLSGIILSENFPNETSPELIFTWSEKPSAFKIFEGTRDVYILLPFPFMFPIL